MSANGPIWHLNPLVKLHWRDWGGDAVVLESTSGQTHQLDRLTAAVVAAFEESPATSADLCARLVDDLVDDLTDDLGDVDAAQLQASIAPILDRLALMGWLRPALP